MAKLVLLGLLAIPLGALSQALEAPKPPTSVPVYKNPKAAIEDRVNDLLSRMTIEDKASQL